MRVEEKNEKKRQRIEWEDKIERIGQQREKTMALWKEYLEIGKHWFNEKEVNRTLNVISLWKTRSSFINVAINKSLLIKTDFSFVLSDKHFGLYRLNIFTGEK